MSENTLVNDLTGEIIEIPTDIEPQQKMVIDLFTDRILELYYQKEAIEEELEGFKYKVAQVCKKYGIKSVDNEYWKINYTPEHKTKRVDTELMKKAKIYESFLKESTVKESVKVTIKHD